MSDWKNVQYKDGKYKTSSGGGGASALSDLTDVDLSNLADGDTLVYDEQNQKWVNGAGGGSGSSSITALNTDQITSLNTPSNLSDAITNYDLILIQMYYTGGVGYPYCGTTIISPLLLSSHNNSTWVDGGNNDRAIHVQFPTTTTVQIIQSNGGNGIHGVYGIKLVSSGGGSSTFAGLDDVDFSNLQNGQVAKYNSTTQKWENANESGGGGILEITYNSADGSILSREYLRNGEDALFNYFHNVWSDEQGGTPIADVTKNVQTDLELFYARSDAKMYSPLFQKMQSNSSSAMYVADKRCTVLAINSETLHETVSFTTVTTITTTGTVIDTINNHVDTAAAPLCCGGLTLSVISLEPGDSITFETSSRTSNDERFFGVFECDGISEFTNKTFLCPRDGEYQSNTITYTAESDGYYLCFAEQLSQNNRAISTNILIDDTALSATDYYLENNQNYEQMRIGLAYCETGDVIKLQTNASISNYVGNMFGIYLLN